MTNPRFADFLFKDEWCLLFFCYSLNHREGKVKCNFKLPLACILCTYLWSECHWHLHTKSKFCSPHTKLTTVDFLKHKSQHFTIIPEIMLAIIKQASIKLMIFHHQVHARVWKLKFICEHFILRLVEACCWKGGSTGLKPGSTRS